MKLNHLCHDNLLDLVISVAFSQLAAAVVRPRAEQSNSNLQKLLSSRYGTFDSENGDSDQHSCNLVVKGLSGDVSGNFQLDLNFIPWLRCGVSMFLISEPVFLLSRWRLQQDFIEYAPFDSSTQIAW